MEIQKRTQEQSSCTFQPNQFLKRQQAKFPTEDKENDPQQLPALCGDTPKNSSLAALTNQSTTKHLNEQIKQTNPFRKAKAGDYPSAAVVSKVDIIAQP